MTYKRFYKLFNRLPLHDDEMKERLVQQYTAGRTSSLRAMTAAEYDALCDALERSTADPQHELRKKKRSAALRLMQQLGTTRRTGRGSMPFAGTAGSPERSSVR